MRLGSDPDITVVPLGAIKAPIPEDYFWLKCLDTSEEAIFDQAYIFPVGYRPGNLDITLLFRSR